MKSKKMLLPLFMFNAILSTSINSTAQQNTKDQISTEVDQNSNLQATTNVISLKKQKVWTEFTSALRNTKLSSSISTPTSSLSKGLGIDGGYSMKSRPSLGEKFSGIDIWDINIGATSELFGPLKNAEIGTGTSVSRQFTFIQQFDSRLESIQRLPYDPVTKIPLNADLFFKTQFNKTTQKNERVIKDGDFIGFRAPLTLSLGRGYEFAAKTHIALDASLYWVLAGEFDIHIFKMKDDQVRVKIMAIKDNLVGGYLGLNLMGFSSVGNRLVSSIFGTNLAKFEFSTKKSNLYISDYIFNLNQPESRDMYNELIGHKLKSLDTKELKSQLLTANPFAKGSSTKKYLMGDLERLNLASKADQNLPASERRITRVGSGENETVSSQGGFKINLLKAVQSTTEQSQSVSKATLYAQDQNDLSQKYLLETMTRNNSFQWFWLWGESDLITQSLLLKTDQDFQPEDLLGFQFSRIKEDSSMTNKEYLALKQKFNSILPVDVSTAISWPNWNFAKNDSVHNVYMRQDLLFTDNLFRMNVQISDEKIRAELIKILKSYGKFSSKPMSLSNQGGDGIADPREAAYIRGDNLNAYSSEWEQYVIPIKLAEVFDSSKTATERYQAYQYLTKNIPVFSEINNMLLLRLIPDEALSQIIVAKLTLSAKDQTTSESFYPSKEKYNNLNRFREIANQTQYILNRTFDLRNFIKEDGTIYSTDEIMQQRTSR
jgi:hypothetical protein